MVKVRVGESHGSVIKSNCVTARWSGEQLAMNDQSVGDEPDSAGCCGEPAWVRYADDCVILCQSREEAESALASVRVWMAEHELSLHPDKTHIGDCREPGQGFEFLGYRFEAGRRTVRRKSLNQVRDAIRLRTRRTSGEAIERTIQKLNPVLKGWFGYFKHAHKYTFNTLDAFVRRRLRAILLKQNKKRGCANSQSGSFRGKNAYFAERGLFSLHEAYVTASQSR